MQRRENIVITFGFLIVCLFILFLLRNTGLMRGVGGLAQGIFSPIESAFVALFQGPSNAVQSKNAQTLIAENKNLQLKLADLEKLQQDNKALYDQFQVASPQGNQLLPAHIVAMPQFVPGISVPDELVIDKGSADGVRKGAAVIVGNQLMGKISQVTDHRSKVTLVSSTDFSLTAKTSKTGASGVIRGQGGGEIVLENVVLSDNLSIADMVVTKGSEDISGIGIPPDLVIGKIVSIDKKASNLFQSAKIKSLTDVTHLSIVFIYLP